MMNRVAVICQVITAKRKNDENCLHLIQGDKVMILGSSVKKVFDFLDIGHEVDACMSDGGEGEETEEEELLVRAEIECAFEDIRRQERIMGLVEHCNADEFEST